MDFAGVYGVSGQRFGSKADGPKQAKRSQKKIRRAQVEFDDMDPASEKNRTMIDTPQGP